MTPCEFTEAYPQFATVCEDVIQRQLTLFSCLYQRDYGCVTDHLTGLFVAHQIAVSSAGGNGAVQTVAGKSVGDVSISYSKSPASDKAGDFASTKYGIEFFRLLSMFGMGPIMAGATSG